MALIAILLTVVITMVFALRRRITSELSEPTSPAQVEHESPGESGGRLSSMFRVTRISDDDPIPTPSPTRIRRLAPEDRKEDFDAQKQRAFGDSMIYGVVTGEKQAPLADATVQLFENDPMTKNPPLREATTDENGSFTLNQLNDGDMRFIVVAKAQGYAPEVRRVVLSGMPDQMFIRLQQGVTLSGITRDAESSATISGVTIFHPTQSEAVFAMLGTVQSDAAGRFSFDAVRPGAGKVLAEKPGYHRVLKSSRAPDENLEIAMMPGGATIRGTTVERLTEKPAGGAKVLARTEGFSASTMSGEDGAFEFTDMPGGKFVVVAVKGMASAPETLELEGNEVKGGVTLMLPSALFVSGRVVDANSGKMMPGVRIYYNSPAGKKSTLSDENGLFAFETMVLDQYTMEVHEKGYLPVLDKRTTGSVETITRKVPKGESSDKVTIRMRPVPAIAGTVKREAKSGELRPASGVEVAVAYIQGKVFERKLARTDPTGNFFVNLPDRKRGQAKVVAERRGSIGSATGSIPSRKGFDVVLRPTHLLGALVLSDETELSGVRVRTQYPFPEGKGENTMRLPGEDMYTNNKGRFLLPVPQREKIELVFDLPDGVTITKPFGSDALIRRGMRLFIYDPVARDVLSNVSDIMNRQDRQRQKAESRARKKPNQKPTPQPTP